MGRRIESFDWGATPLGPVESWSPVLRATLPVMLANRFPHILWWGPQHIQFYNDAYRPILGVKHWERALGQAGPACWDEVWPVIGPLVERPYHGGEPTWDDDILLEVNRFGFMEESHFTIAYSPVPDETVPSGIGGVLATVHEITAKVIGERRVATLRDLGLRLGGAKTEAEACELAAATLALHDRDAPFAVLYLLAPDGKSARLAGEGGLGKATELAPALIDLTSNASSPWPIMEALEQSDLHEVGDLAARFAALPPGPWSDPPSAAIVLPIPSSKPGQWSACLIAGLSARLRFDEAYRDFFELVKTQISTALANARVLEEERQRAQKLAELDRAKTAFFSNVSHEFRTPLTLMLGPLAEILGLPETDLALGTRAQLEIVQRNGLRLLRLVNSLLDFARIQAGRTQAVFQPTDLATLTTELASVFRSATDRAGLRLSVECPPLPEAVFVDREMWEKVVLNLISNAFKFTFEGEIAVSLLPQGDSVELSVRDTGVGIAAAEMPRLFERFHRIANSRCRTHEGSGIGLALVQELTLLHGGKVCAESEEGRGSKFVVTLPLGKAHLPAENLFRGDATAAKAPAASIPFVEEALRWLPDLSVSAGDGATAIAGPTVPFHASPSSAAKTELPHVYVADDNADMRQYLARLLGEHYAIQTFADGRAVFEAARARRPDLILSDVMMPVLDGAGLVREVRADPELKELPIILLSARAGEESRIEGFSEGADDYLVKPFSARELLARIDSHLKLAQVQREATEALRRRTLQFETLLNQAPIGVYLIDADFRIAQVNPAARPVFGDLPDLLGRDFAEVMEMLWGPEDAKGLIQLFRHTLETGEPYAMAERQVRRPGASSVEFYDWRIDRITLPEGRFGVVCYFREVSAQVRARETIHSIAQQLLLITNIAPVYIAHVDRDLRYHFVNEAYAARLGLKPEECRGKYLWEVIGVPAYELIKPHVERSLSGERVEFDMELPYAPLGLRHMHCRYAPERDAKGQCIGLVAAIMDVTARRRAELAVRESEERLRVALAQAEAALGAKDDFLAALSHELRNPLTPVLMSATELATDPELPQRARDQLAMIQRNVTLEARLIDDLLDLNRLTRGKLIIHPAPADAHLLLRHAEEIVRADMAGRDLDMCFELNAEEHFVVADATRLQQVFWNVLKNAVKFTPDGGFITVSTSNPQADVLRISIADTGRGIAPEILPRIFNAFDQGDLAMRHGFGGLGLGLAISKALMDLHGGELLATSDGLGRGAVFTITLRATAAHPASHAPAPSRSVTEVGRLRLLVAEDHTPTLDAISRLLRRAGHEVHPASSISDALRLAARYPCDLLISDLGLPDGSGLELMRQIKVAHGLPGIALSGFGMEKDLRLSHEAGFEAHLIKPVDISELLRVIRRVMAHHPMMANAVNS